MRLFISVQTLEWQLECEIKGRGHVVRLPERRGVAAQRHVPPEAGISVQPCRRWAGGCRVPLGLGPSGGVAMGDLLPSSGCTWETPAEVEYCKG